MRGTAELSAEHHLAALIESSHDAIISKNLDGIVQSWNPAAERIFGYLAEEIVGKSILILIPPEHLHEEEMILGKLKAGERIEHYEAVRRRKDGTSIDVSITVSPILDEHGNVVGGSKIARDVTERRRADFITYRFARSSNRLKTPFSAKASTALFRAGILCASTKATMPAPIFICEMEQTVPRSGRCRSARPRCGRGGARRRGAFVDQVRSQDAINRRRIDVANEAATVPRNHCACWMSSALY